jgi:putative Holliday junction resolvase
VGRILGVDLGERRIGLALSDPGGVLAVPHAVIERRGDPAADRAAILDAARSAGAQRVVVGLPLSLSGRPGPAARSVLAEVDQLRLLAGDDLPVETFDERFTTVSADRALVSAGKRSRERRRVVDQAAAAVMLQAWLERHR